MQLLLYCFGTEWWFCRGNCNPSSSWLPVLRCCMPVVRFGIAQFTRVGLGAVAGVRGGCPSPAVRFGLTCNGDTQEEETWKACKTQLALWSMGHQRIHGSVVHHQLHWAAAGLEHSVTYFCVWDGVVLRHVPKDSALRYLKLSHVKGRKIWPSDRTWAQSQGSLSGRPSIAQPHSFWECQLLAASISLSSLAAGRAPDTSRFAACPCQVLLPLGSSSNPWATCTGSAFQVWWEEGREGQ